MPTGVPTSVHGGGISQEFWDEVATMCKWHKLMSSQAQFKDTFTGEPLTTQRCLYNCQELDRAQQLMQAGIHYFKKRMRDPSQEGTFGYFKQARHDCEAGGSYNQLWNCLSDDKIAITLVVTAPPAGNQDVAYSNERNLLIAIYQCDPSLQGLCQDICTCIKEIGTLSKTLIYARYPYHMGERLQKLCKVLNTVTAGDHKFSAHVATAEDMAKLHHSVVDVKPWELHINGQRLAALDKEALTAATRMQPAACEDNFMKLMTQHTYHLAFHKSIAGDYQSALNSVWLPEYQWIQDTTKAWRLAQKLASNDEMQTMQVYFLISGLVIAASSKGMIESGADVFLYTCSQAFYYDDDQQLFMSTNAGDKILALDQPFRLTFSKSSEWFKLDDDGCIWAVYGLKYDVDGDKGIVIKHAGITLVQHLTSKYHQNQLHIFSGQMTPHIAQFSAKIAVKQSGTFGEPASSSNSISTNLSDLE